MSWGYAALSGVVSLGIVMLVGAIVGAAIHAHFVLFDIVTGRDRLSDPAPSAWIAGVFWFLVISTVAWRYFG